MDDFMQRAVLCPVCSNLYDFDNRLPHITPCGHTTCNRCLEPRRRDGGGCPQCSQDFDPLRLTVNKVVVDMLESYARDTLKRRLEGLLPEEMLDRCSKKRALQAVGLAGADSWEVTLRSGQRVLTGALRDCRPPRVAALLLFLALQAQLDEVPEVAGDAGHMELQEEGAPDEAVNGDHMLLQDDAVGRSVVQELEDGAVRDGAMAAVALELQQDEAEFDEDDGDTGPLELQADDVLDLCRGSRVTNETPAVWMRRDIRRTEIMEKIRHRGVTRLKNVICGRAVGDGVDYSWALVLLLCASPTLEELHAERLHDEHLMAVHDMLRLRRLSLSHYAGNAADPLELPALPIGHRGLQWLSVDDFPRATLHSMLLAHAATLEELRLPGEHADLLVGEGDESAFPALKTLWLLRAAGATQCTDCRGSQCTALMVQLPGVQVLCSACDAYE